MNKVSQLGFFLYNIYDYSFSGLNILYTLKLFYFTKLL